MRAAAHPYSEVEYSPDPLWQRLKQQLLCDVAVRYLSGKVLGDTLRIGPLAQHPPNHTCRCQASPSSSGSSSKDRTTSAPARRRAASSLSAT